jgi:outer membrane protein insertion porin family
MRLRTFLALLVAAPLCTGTAAAQESGASSNPSSVCGVALGPPAALPPDGSAPIVYLVSPCFLAQNNATVVDLNTYLYYMQIKDKTSRPSQNIWIPYTEEVEQIMRSDFKTLWGTNFLDDLSIETQDYTFANGVVGKIILYNMEERQRVKNVDYIGSKKVDRAKVEEKLKQTNTVIRLDTFIDPALVKKVEAIALDLLKEKGFQSAEVSHEITETSGGPKQVNVVFKLNEGPKVKIRRVDFVGNNAISDRALARRMKENRAQWWLSWITGRGTYQEVKFEEDAERVLEHYRNQGYIRAQVGDPEVRTLRDSGDKKTRWIELRIPVTEGSRYRVKGFEVAGNKVVKTDALTPLFKVKTGEYYNWKDIRKGFQKAQEIYGAGGYMDFTGYPEYKFSDDPTNAPQTPEQTPPAPDQRAAAAERQAAPTVDVTLKIEEGKQYFVNRITFTGNTTTRDNVIRRELRLYEGNIFDTQSLQYSIKRLNQLGYFKPLEGPGKDVNIDKITAPDKDNKVDVRLKLEEQNRNQLTFGAGVSQFEGFFGQLSFQTANFLGRGESLTVSLQGGQRAQDYTLAFTEPFLFDRNITGGINLFKRDVRYIGQFTQKSTGGVLTFGMPVGRGFTRFFTNYAYERVNVTEVSDAYNDPLLLARNPFLRDALLLEQSGDRVISRVTPSLVYNSVDQPIFPTTGKRLSLSTDFAGLGGNTKFVKPVVEGVMFLKQNNRMSLGFRAQVEYIRNLSSRPLPIFERLFLGGEYSLRGFDLRQVGPQDLETLLVLGGNKSLLFNVEQIVHIAGPVRLILFYDAGQVRDVGQGFAWKEDALEIVPNIPVLFDPFATATLTPEGYTPVVRSAGLRSAFKTSTGAEIRFFMPVLNVPFRLIFAHNPQRGGVLDNSLRPQKAFQFRFAVGTTF